ncbi:MAG: sigma-70 family RNA polymerase sigma factor [Sinomicrobium sp.]|nr:sigma-70 family RNA polymerase sigma factor [Sinomicrobium sp.]
MINNFSETEIVANIRAGGLKRQQALTQIYREKQLKNQVIAFVQQNSGNREDGIDIFHEGIIALDLNIRQNKYQQTGKLNAYLFSTCRFLWLNQLKKKRRMVYTDEHFQLDQEVHHNPESLFMSEEQKEVINTLLSNLTEKCKLILELWKLSYSMEEIAEQASLKNAAVARKQRYNCYQKFLHLIDEHPGLKSALK